MNTIKQIAATLAIIFTINMLINWVFVGKNNGEKYVDAFIGQQKK